MEPMAVINLGRTRGMERQVRVLIKRFPVRATHTRSSLFH